MRRLAKLLRTSPGQKALVAVTGLLLIGFLILHAAGNLSVFSGVSPQGESYLDAYAAFLTELGAPLLPNYTALWLLRVLLLAILLIHIGLVVHLVRTNRAARPIRPAHPRRVAPSPAAAWMFASGLLLALFLIVHLGNFLFGALLPSRFVAGEVYANLYHAFRHWVPAGFYLLAMAALGLHLYHGTWSLFQTLGIDNPDRNTALRRLAAVLALTVAGTFAAVPAAFLTGLLDAPAATPAPPTKPGSH